MTQDFSQRFKALANRNRLAIFEYLRQHELVCEEDPETCCSVGDIAQQFDIALSTVSHHLKVLYEAGLIECEQRGQYSYCTLNRQAVDELVAFLAS